MFSLWGHLFHECWNTNAWDNPLIPTNHPIRCQSGMTWRAWWAAALIFTHTEWRAAPWLGVTSDLCPGAKQPSQPKELQIVKNEPPKLSGNFMKCCFSLFGCFLILQKLGAGIKARRGSLSVITFIFILAVPGRGTYCENMSLKLKLISQEPPYLFSVI